jgi:3-oxoacyl-[acyl-carrier protein] reductase
MTRAAQQVFTQQKYGKVICLSSVSALGNRGQANYAAAKMGIQGFVRTLGIELGPFGVNVNAIAPGFIATDMTEMLTAADRERIQRRSALRRLAEPEDVAAAVEFLLSEKAKNITGTTLTVDAGNTA